VDGRQWWGVGLQYLAAFALEYGAYLWIPLLAAAVVAHRRLGSLFVPGLFASVIIPHALYVASIGGDHFEFRPLTLYFPLVFLLLADGLRFALDRPRLAAIAAANLGLILLGLWVIPWQSHLQFPQHYVSGFPGRDPSAEAGAWLSPERGPIARLPVIRSILATHRRLLGSLSSNYVGLRAEEHRLFLATVVPDGLRLRGLIDRGVLPRDLHLATGCVGAVPYYADVRTLDLLGLTDAYVAHQPFHEKHSMGHDKMASQAYVRRSGVDLMALAGVHPFLRTDSDRLVGLVMNAVAQSAPWYAADIGDGEDMVCAFPEGADRAFARMPRLRFQRLADSAFARPLFRQAVLRFQDALRRDPTSVEDRMVLGDLLLFQDEFHAAAAAYEDVLLRGGESMQVRMNLATAYERGGFRERAIPSLKRALVMARAGGDAAVIANVEGRLAADASAVSGRRGGP
jgi:hypothetical protein